MESRMIDAFNPNTAKTVRVIFKGDAEPVFITETMSQAIKTAGTWLTLEDPVTGKIIYDGAKSEIKRLEHADLAQKAKEFHERRWICEYGHRHTLNQECSCMKRYTCPPGYFSMVFWKKTEGTGMYPQDLQEPARISIAAQATDEWCEEKERLQARFTPTSADSIPAR